MSAVARFRESLTLVLIALLPMHAVAVTVFTNFVAGQGHAPFAVFALWKEAALLLLILLSLAEIVRQRDPDADRRIWSLDFFDWCLLFAVALGAFASFRTGTSSSFTALTEADKKFLLGFKYDFLPPLLFFVLRRVSWSRDFRRSAGWVLVGAGSLFAFFGLLTLVAPMQFFTALGYSDLHSLYRPNAPLAAYQMVEGTDLRRIQSVMSGPNQFGLWLLLPFAATLQWCAHSFKSKQWFRGLLSCVTGALLLVALAHTYSRSAWVGAAAMTSVFALLLLGHVINSVLHRSLAIGIAGVLTGIALVIGLRSAPELLIRNQSLIGHLQKPLQALSLMREHPLGMGLGAAGPASNRFSDTCVFFDLGADISWAKKRTDICVFVGGVRRIPPGKVCDCPLLTENWYLQWGVEMGYLGFVFAILIILLPLVFARVIPPASPRIVGPLALLGVATGGLFLHSFEDAAVAYTIWILLAASALRKPAHGEMAI